MTRNKPATKINMDRLKKDIERHPDDYQWQPGQRFGVTQSAIHYALQRLGVSYKKRCNIQRRTNRQATPSFIWMKAGLLRRCPGRMAIRKGNTLLRDSGLPCWGAGECHGCLA